MNISGICIAVAMGLSACGHGADTVVPKFEVPKVDIPNIDLSKVIPQDLVLPACSKPESEIPKDRSENQRPPVDINKVIPTVDIQKIGCDGKVKSTSERKDDFRNYFNEMISLNGPNGLSEPVEYVSIENFRTCDISKMQSSVKDPELTEYDRRVDAEGSMVFMLTSDSMFRFTHGLVNVVEGRNVLKVTYFGKCKKLKEGKAEDKDNKEKEEAPIYDRCEVENPIYSEDLTYNIKIDRSPRKTEQQRDCN